ncbi:UNVERIFIED_CONTAM: hypothetical protein K2H54_056055, partial [Gekko kuhli]
DKEAPRGTLGFQDRMVFLARMGIWEFLVKKDLRVMMGLLCQVIRDFLALQDFLALEGLQDHQDLASQVHTVSVVYREIQEALGASFNMQQDILGIQAHLVLQVSEVRLVTQVKKVKMVLRWMVLQDCQVLLDLRVRRVFQVTSVMGFQEFQATGAFQDCQVCVASEETQAFLGFKDSLAHQDPQELKVLEEVKVLLEP